VITSSTFVESFSCVRADVERFAVFLTRDRSFARDLVQDALEAALRHHRKIKDSVAMKHYMITVILRQYHRQRSVAARFDGIASQDLGISYESTVEQAMDLQRLHQLIDELPHDKREAVLLVDVEGFSVAEAAELLSCSVSAVKMRLVRARDILRRRFDPQHESIRTTP